MNWEIQLKLNALMQAVGPAGLASPAEMEARIRAEIGENKDASLLLMAFGAGVPQSLLADPSSAAAVTQKLQDEYFMSPEPADAAVQAWATALGVNVATLIVHHGPALPHVEVVEPPSMRASPAVVLPAAPPPRRSNGTAIALVVVALLVLVGAGTVYFIPKKTNEVLSDSQYWAAPKPQSSATTNQIPIIPGGVKANKASQKTLPPVVGKTSGSGADLDLAAYNSKMVEEHQVFEQAAETFGKAGEAVPTTVDFNEQMDQQAPLWDSYSQTIGMVAADLDAITPPPDASAIHRKLADFTRQLSALMEVGAQAARDHDENAFRETATKVTDLAMSAGNELSPMITAAGFDPDQNNKDWTLVKRK